MRKAKGVRGGRAGARAAGSDDDQAASNVDVMPNGDGRPRCRIEGCGCVLENGTCPACRYRAKHFAKLFEAVSPNCECGAPKRWKRPGFGRGPKYCPLCTKLRVKMRAKGLA